MQTETIHMTRTEARELYREYKTHAHYSTPIDRECMRTYQLLAQGRLIIKARESIIKAGVNEKGFPKLAICRADSLACEARMAHDGSCRMNAQGAMIYWRHGDNSDTSRVFNFPAGAFPTGHWRNATALIPPIPLHLRPRRGLANYHILWEAEWTKIVPRDPYLLRRIGKSDMWVVTAMWELTEVERAALASRLTNA